jgi:superfamily II DNA or RNA helicase
MSRKQRATLIAELDALPPDAPRILLATGKLVGEGFDHPPLNTLVLAMPISWKGTLQQYAGWLHRQHADKASVRIIDFVDAGHPALLRMWDKRQRGYRTMGYRIAEAQTVMQVMPQSIHPNARRCHHRRSWDSMDVDRSRKQAIVEAPTVLDRCRSIMKAARGDPTQSGGTSDGKTSAVRRASQANQRLVRAVDD